MDVPLTTAGPVSVAPPGYRRITLPSAVKAIFLARAGPELSPSHSPTSSGGTAPRGSPGERVSGITGAGGGVGGVDSAGVDMGGVDTGSSPSSRGVSNPVGSRGASCDSPQPARSEAR